LKELIEECTQNELNEDSMVTLENDGKYYKLFTTQPGERKHLAAMAPVESNSGR